MKISIIAGARPNFMKIAPLVRTLRHLECSPRLIHTGQHYDQKMSDTFFHELNIPEPDVNLGIGSGDHIWQITEVMRRLAEDFKQYAPDMVVVVGDVNSTVAAAFTAAKMGIPVAHVEAGLRSFDRTMPEELNRIVTDSVSDLLFASESTAVDNLKSEGVVDEKIILVGNVMIDTLLSHLESARALRSWDALGVPAGNYALLTLHRPSNVDDPVRLESILRAVHQISRQIPVIFPIHPRTQRQIQTFGFADNPELNGYISAEPLGYLPMLSLMDSARVVLTDSGGVQEETTALRIPCLTLRENTERPITSQIGSNRIVGWQTNDILSAFERVSNGPERIGQIPELWDGRAAERIAQSLQAHITPQIEHHESVVID